MFTAVWDLVNDRVERKLRDVTVYSFSPDGRYMIGTSQWEVLLFDTATGKVEHRFNGLGAKALGTQMSPDGKSIAAVCRPTGVCVWDIETRHLRALVSQPAAKPEPLPPGEEGVDFNTLAWLPKSNAVVVARSRAAPRLYDSTTGRLIREYAINVPPHLGTFSADYLLVTPNGKTLIAGSLSSGWSAWDIQSGKLLPQPAGNGESNGLALAPDGKEFAVADHGRVDRYDAATLEPKPLCSGPRATIADIQFSPTGEDLAVATADQAIFLYESRTGKLRLAIHGLAETS